MAHMGAAVVINYRENRERAQEVLQKVTEGGGKGIIFQADVTEKKAVEDMDRTIREKFGTVDVIVNNAGFHVEMGHLLKISWDGLIAAPKHELGGGLRHRYLG